MLAPPRQGHFPPEHPSPRSRDPSKKIIEALRNPEQDQGHILGMKLPNKIIEHFTVTEIKDLRLIFRIFDVDESDFLDFQELMILLNLLGFDLPNQEVRKIIRKVEFESHELVSFQTFLFILMDQEKNNFLDQLDEIRSGFKSFVSSDGKITLESLQRSCEDAGLRLRKKDLKEMIKIADTDGNGFVDEDEFISIISKTHLF